MTLHREGYATILISLVLLGAISLSVWISGLPAWICWTISIILFVTFLFILRFFRYPSREKKINNKVITSPADGKVIAVNEENEGEYFKDKRIKISVFMSGFNVHANWVPVSGIVQYTKYHPGRNLFAVHPKSSELNERASVVLKPESGKEILVRQIAGVFARRVVTYPRVGELLNQGDELGFIKFGSRLDIFLPIDTEVKVKIGDKVWGKVSELASW
jgi:phosphatidylserine decarboxylase